MHTPRMDWSLRVNKTSIHTGVPSLSSLLFSENSVLPCIDKLRCPGQTEIYSESGNEIMMVLIHRKRDNDSVHIIPFSLLHLFCYEPSIISSFTTSSSLEGFPSCTSQHWLQGSSGYQPEYTAGRTAENVKG
jgi:hypothetical protein